MSPSPGAWKSNRGWQIGKFVFGFAYGFIVFYFIKLDLSFWAFAKSTFWLIGLAYLADFLVLKKKCLTIQFLLGLGFIGIFLWVLAVMPLSSYKDLHQLADADVQDFYIEELAIENIPVIPLEYAKYKGDKLMSQVPNYSFYEIGSYSIQKIDNELYWVAPIEFAGFFAKNRAEYSPGYIKVSAEDMSMPAEFVDGFRMVYVPSNYFGDNLQRMVRREYPSLILAETSFEPDDTGKPFYAVSYGRYLKGRTGFITEGVVLVDPQTGEMQKFSKEDMPSFVDQIIPANIAEKYNNYFGRNKHGLFNSLFAKRDVHIPTNWESSVTMMAVFDSDKNMMWFTDHTTPSSKDNSMVGFSLMDARTGELTYYTNTESMLNGIAATKAVNDQFVREQFRATAPVLYNIYGEKTWIIAVIDRSSLMQGIALVHAPTGTMAFGKTKTEAFENYKITLVEIATLEDAVPTDSQATVEAEGIIRRVNSLTMGGNTTYNIILENNNKIFRVSPVNFPYVVFSEPGDSVYIQYVENDELISNAVDFENLTLNQDNGLN